MQEVSVNFLYNYIFYIFIYLYTYIFIYFFIFLKKNSEIVRLYIKKHNKIKGLRSLTKCAGSLTVSVNPDQNLLFTKTIKNIIIENIKESLQEMEDRNV